MSETRKALTSLVIADQMVAGEWTRVFGGAYFSFYFSFFSESLPAGQDVV